VVVEPQIGCAGLVDGPQPSAPASPSAPNGALTDATFNMRQAPFASGWFVGDYVGTGTDGSDFLPFWSQPFGADPSNTFIRRVGLTP
jgi:hypothetical protein